LIVAGTYAIVSVMDVLSDVLAVLRSGRPVSAVAGWDGAFAQEFAEVPGAMGFQVVLRGSCWLLPPGGGEPVRLTAGDVVFRPCGRAHALASSPDAVPSPCTGEQRPGTAPCTSEQRPGTAPCTGEQARPAGTEVVTLCGAYEIGAARTHPLLDGLPELVLVAPTEELRAAVGLLTAELAGPRPGTDAAVPALLDLLLLYLLRGCYAPAADGWGAALRDPVTGVALQAMHRDPARRWTVASLAAQAGLSRAPFARRFTALVGRPPLAYLTWWRMTVAARTLRESDATVAVVARLVGYSSEFAFATAFRREHGCAPGRYRRRP
jgi:AraC-like DNA-binding protein